LQTSFWSANNNLRVDDNKGKVLLLYSKENKSNQK
jgi:hypothetical protein